MSAYKLQVNAVGIHPSKTQSTVGINTEAQYSRRQKVRKDVVSPAVSAAPTAGHGADGTPAEEHWGADSRGEMTRCNTFA